MASASNCSIARALTKREALKESYNAQTTRSGRSVLYAELMKNEARLDKLGYKGG